MMGIEHDEQAIRREAAHHAAEDTLALARAGREHLEEVLNDCVYHADKRARILPLTSDEERMLEKAQLAIQTRDPAKLESATHALCHHYATEIGGHFDPKVYTFASRLAPRAFSLLLSATSLPRLLVEGIRVEEIEKRLVLSGQLKQIQRLTERGTVLCTPTHGSHLDSVVMAYALFLLDLPPFIYGAGKNLFSNKLIGFFMQNLGAYKVDRLKDEQLYKRTLKQFCVATLRHRMPNLFFPGGTRSRSGAIERELKLGLLGCGLEAYIRNLQDGRDRPRVFIVPATVSYHLTLEAETLIHDYLRDDGKSRYIIDDDEFTKPERVLKFMNALLKMDGQIHVRFGRALDPFGNTVNLDGDSLDPHGRLVDPSRYVLDARGLPVLDAARDREYTRELGAAITERLRAGNTILPTHITCFALMHAMVERSGERDLYRVLRSPAYREGFLARDVVSRVERLLAELTVLSNAGQLHLPPDLHDAREVVAQAERALSLYHLPKVLERNGPRLIVENSSLVYYYHNRLTGYGLDPYPTLIPGARKGNRK
jgi:glycerol-3-phosphate O-acyltransferase